jgi:hypothetical protein
MKISSLFQVALISGILCLTACSEDFLTTTPPGVFSEANYFKNIHELETGLVACYSMINYHYQSWWFGEHLPTGLWVIGNLGSDDSEVGGTFGFMEYFGGDISVSRQKSDNYMVKFWWWSNYSLIARCNMVIDKSKTLLEEPDPGELEIIVDQAKFLRAFAYYNLVTIFGDVPLTTKWLTPDELNLERSPDSLVWIQIKEDLADASNLPLQSKSQRGRATRGAALALQGKVFLWQGEFANAVEAYEAIIESGEYQLMDEYGKIHHPDWENNAESILEFQEEIGVPGGDMVSLLGICRLPLGHDQIELRDIPLGWGLDNPTQDLLEEFEEGDPRIIYTFNFEGDVFAHPDSQYTNYNVYSST